MRQNENETPDIPHGNTEKVKGELWSEVLICKSKHNKTEYILYNLSENLDFLSLFLVKFRLQLPSLTLKFFLSGDSD